MPAYNHSQLTMYRSCQKKWALYASGAKAEDQSGDLIFGSALHFALAKMLQGETPEDCVALWHMYWDSVKAAEYGWGRFGYEYYKGMGERFLKKFSTSYLNDIEPIWVEKKLQGVINGVEVYGTPDVVCKFRGVESILDFKTSSGNYDVLQATTGTQMAFYHALVKQQEAAPEIKQYVYLVFNKSKESLQRPVIATVTEELHKAHMEDIGRTLLEMHAPMSDGHCVRNPAQCFSYNRPCEYMKQCWGSLLPKGEE